MFKTPIFMALTVLLTFSACSVKEFKRFDHNQDANTTVTKISNEDYAKELRFEWKIEKGDRIEISAFNQSSNSGGQLSQLLNTAGQKIQTTRIGDEGLLIGTSGEVNLPLVGNVKIAGLTESEASEKLITIYKKYLRNPYISVKILNQRLFVIGEVKRPGVFLVNHGTMNLFEALALSGDLTDYANRQKIRIIRGDMRHTEVREIDLTDFKSLSMSSMILRPNDIVYVEPRDDRASMVGYGEEQPWVNVLNGLLSPITASAVIYGVVK